MASLFRVGNCFVCSGNYVAMVGTLQPNMMSPGDSLQILGVPTREHCPAEVVYLAALRRHTETTAVHVRRRLTFKRSCCTPSSD